jgi:hypothetical protein
MTYGRGEAECNRWGQREKICTNTRTDVTSIGTRTLSLGLLRLSSQQEAESFGPSILLEMYTFKILVTVLMSMLVFF